MSFKQGQEGIYRRIGREGFRAFPGVQVGALDPNRCFRSMVVVMRHGEQTRDALTHWGEQVSKALGPEWWSPNPKESLHITVGNSGPTGEFREDPDRTSRLKALVWGGLKDRACDWGEVRYSWEKSERGTWTGKPVILGKDSIMAAGNPDDNLVTSMMGMADRLTPEAMGRPWGSHTTLGRFRKEGTLTPEVAACLLGLERCATFPPTRITTLDVAVQENVPGQGYSVEPRERFTFKRGAWHLAE